MKMTGEQRIAAPREAVWKALNDPAVLKACIPGCQSLEAEADGKLKATVAIKVGPIGAKFAGAVTISDARPPESYRITGEGQGGAAGFARGAAAVRLAADGSATVLSYEVDVTIGGKLAQLGGAIIDATAKRLTGQFFDRFGGIVEGGGAVPGAATAAATAEAAGVAPVPAAAQSATLAASAPAPSTLRTATIASAGTAVVVLAAVFAGFRLGQGSAKR